MISVTLQLCREIDTTRELEKIKTGDVFDEKLWTYIEQILKYFLKQ